MTVIEPQALGAIEALVQERQKYERWLQVLEERRAETAARVFERVHGDYTARIRHVAEQLSGRSGELESSVAALKQALDEMRAEEDRVNDERSEAELRAAVGEYEPEKWDEIRTASDAKLEQLSANRSDKSGELKHLEELLSLVTMRPAGSETGSGGSGDASGSTAAGGAGAGPAAPSAAGAGEMAAAEAREAVEANADSGSSRKTPSSPAFDELAFLSSVVENEIAQLPPHPDAAPQTPAEPKEIMTEEPARAEVAPERRAAPASGAARAVRAPTPLINEPVHTADHDDRSLRRAEEVRMNAMDRRLSGSVPAYLKDVPKEVTKSLKCGECGTMNYPTEWYCERCGGELAAL